MARRARGWQAVIGLLVAGLALAACGADEPSRDQPVLRVYADSLLKTPFEDLGRAFERDHDVDVRYTFGDSPELVTRLQQGASADLIALADVATMQHAIPLSEGPWAGFAFNRLAIAVAPGNPRHLKSLVDLTKKGVRAAICVPELPCGTSTTLVAKNAKVELTSATREQSAADVIDAVASGRADAGLVYVTDIRAAGDKVDRVDFAGAKQVLNIYSIAPVTAPATQRSKPGKGATAAEALTPSTVAMEFWNAVVREPGQTLLDQAGFMPVEQPDAPTD